MFEFNDRLTKTMERFEAFFNFDVADRPPLNITLWKDDQKVVPQKIYSDYKDKWLDFDFRIEEAVAKLENTLFFGDALPVIWPNMGPEIFSAWCGCGYNYGDRTTWSEPCIKDWDIDIDKGKLDRNHPLLLKTIEYTDLLIEASNGRFIVGLTDFHPGGDHIAALRDPQELCIDMIENLNMSGKN